MTPSPIRFALLICLLLSLRLAHAEYKAPFTILKDITTWQVHRDGTSVQDWEQVIRIDTPQGAGSEAQQVISFDAAAEKVTVVDAYSVRPDGKRLAVPKGNIRVQDEAVDSDAPVFSNAKQLYIVFLQVSVGSTLHIKTRAVQHKPDFKGEFFQSHHLQPHVQSRDVQVHVLHDPAIHLQMAGRGITGGRVPRLPGDRRDYLRHSFHLHSGPALPPEPSQVALADVATALHITSFADQAALGRAYLRGARASAQVTPAIQRQAQQLTAGLTTDADKVRALYNWVSHNIRYVGMYMNLSGFVPHGAESVLRNRYGDCKDHVALLEALLRAVNIDSSPVLVNSGAAYELPPVASSATFNHAITYVPSLDLFVDSTAQFAPVGTLPPSVQGKPALITATGQIKTTPASSAERDGTETTTHLTLALDGSVKGSSKSLMKGSAEVNSRHAQFSMANEDPLTISRRILAVERESGSGRITPNDPSNLNIPWVVEASFELEPLINLPGPSAFVVPVGIAPGSINLLARQTLRDDRQFPYRCQDESHSQTTYITLPPDVTVNRLPEDVAFKAEGLQYRASYKQTGSTIQVQRHYSAQRGKSVCTAQDEVARGQMLKTLRRDLRAQVFLR